MSRTVCPSAISSPIHSGTRLQTDEAKRQASEIVENLRPSQLDMRYRAIARVGGVHLEDMLGDVETNDSDLHRMLLLAYLHQPPQWHAGAGVQGPSIPSMPGSGTSCSTARSSTLSARSRSSSRAGAG